MSDSSGRELFLARVRRHERALALAWLLIVGVVGLAVVVDPVRVRILNAAQRGVQHWDDRWTERLQEGERLVAEGRFAEAAAYLERLDRMHPARNVRHGRDKERELVLRLLGQSYEALDRRTLTIETYQRLVAFDPRHYRNHFELAQASDRLLSRATMAPEARDAYAAVLGILPAHLPSVRGFTQYYLDRGEFIPVVEGYERYLDAFLVQGVLVRLGDQVVRLPVLVDGRPRDYDVTMDPDRSAGDVLAIATEGFAVSVERVDLLPATRAGVEDHVAPVSADLANPVLVDFEPAEHGAYRALGPGSELRFQVPGGGGAVAGVRLRLVLFKPVDRQLWTAVSKSFENLLNETGRNLAAARTVTLESPATADRVMGRLDWATEGVLKSAYAVKN